MSYQHYIEHCLQGVLEPDQQIANHNRLSQADYDALLEECAPTLEEIQSAHASQAWPMLALAERRDDLERLEPLAARWRTAFDNVVILGTGGSSLGGQAIYALTDLGFGPPPKAKNRGVPRLRFVDNIGPTTMQALLERADLSKTGFIAISKSGATAETLTQFLLVLQALQRSLDDSRVKLHCLVITQPQNSPLRRIAHRWDIQVLDHDPNIGGRFAALSLVGLLPAMIAGQDAEAVRVGAERILHETLEARTPADSRAAIGAALHVGLMRKGLRNTVLMPYASRLDIFGQWWRQLWAESLGKNHQGSTPISAIGAVDQHSQLQLFLDGPQDKFYTIVTLNTADRGEMIQPDFADDLELDWLAGRTIGDLMDCEARATMDALIENGAPVRHMKVGLLREPEVGLLMMHFMLETIFTARLLKVDPFDQPAVEKGKKLTRRYMLELHQK